ncbi:acetyl-CoA acetyltransferase [Burkholderia multivorans CGD1]|nr:acetyl-CoA acetyltransferase [Burkholderia multivorans CGD1]
MFTDQRDSLHGVAPDIGAAPVRPSKLLRQSSCPLLRACARTGERRKNYNALDERASDHRRAHAECGSTGRDAHAYGPARGLRRRGVPAGSPGVTKRRSR